MGLRDLPNLRFNSFIDLGGGFSQVLKPRKSGKTVDEYVVPGGVIGRLKFDRDLNKKNHWHFVHKKVDGGWKTSRAHDPLR
jgi:hypothetical protein